MQTYWLQLKYQLSEHYRKRIHMENVLWFLSQIHTFPAEDSPCPEGTDLSETVKVNLNQIASCRNDPCGIV